MSSTTPTSHRGTRGSRASTPGEHTLLLSWIPAPLVDAVQAAINVAATEPIAWLAGPYPLHSAWQDVRDLLVDAHRVLDG